MKARIGRTLFGPVHFSGSTVAILQGIKRCLEPLTIRLCCADRRIIGARCLQGMPELQQIALRLGIAFKQLQQGIAEGRTQRLSHIVTAALATDQQSLGHQFLDRFAQ
ncbi:hypothetical protein D3C77_542070 [compost metagenome]